MSPASPNPTSVFRWEDSSALEHSCWACPTKSNSPKAIHTCYGIHSIPCMAYHSTMHAIGTSHRCSACTTSREMHDNRHREIATLVADYHAVENVLEQPPTRRRVLGEHSTNVRLRDLAVNDGQGLEEHITDENDENNSDPDTASTTTCSESSIVSKLTKAERRERKKILKVEKSVRKAVKNEARHAVQVTADDIKKVERILHGGSERDEQSNQTHPLATDKTVEDVIARNLGFVKQIQCHKKALYETVRAGRKEEQERKRVKRRTSAGQQDTEAEAIVDAVLIKLDIDVTAGQAVKKGRAGLRRSGNTALQHDVNKQSSNTKATIIAKLREAIQDDLEKHENDLRQTYIRAGGFFRYAGKAVFERMTEIAKNIDLQTGEEWDKKRKREASAGLMDRGGEGDE